MRIDRIELIRFGHFSGRQIEFSLRQPDFHIVYGDNEAGKSTLLRGISALFFGVPVRTPDVHGCKGSELRLGATISNRDRSLSFRRRKGSSGTLLSLSETQIEEGNLSVFLRELDLGRFEQFFGLNHQRLRQGGEELLRGKGDVGSALFQAAGLLGLRNLLDEIDSNAKDLFTARSRGKVIGNALEEYRHARGEMRRLAISAAAVRERQSELDRARQNQEALKAEAHALQQDLSKLGRIASNKPDVARLKDLRAIILSLDSVPALPEGTRKIRDEAVVSLASAAGHIHALSEQIAKRKERIETLPLNTEFKSRAKDIEELNAGISDYIRATSDKAKRIAEHNDAIRLAEDEWKEVWRKRPINDAQQLKAPYSQKVGILALITEHARLTTALEQADEQLVIGQRELDRVNDELALHPEPSDPAVLVAAIEHAKSLGDTDGTIARLNSDVKRLTLATNREFDTLKLWSGPLESLESFKVPLTTTIDRYARDYEKNDNRRRELNAQLCQTQEIIHKTQEERERLVTKVGQAGERDLAAVRVRRDELWRLIRASAFDKTLTNAEAEKQFTSSMSLPDYFEEQIHRSDEISDLRFTYAKEVAIQDRLVKESETRNAEQRKIEHECVELDNLEAELRKHWISEWKEFKSEILSPPEMREWMQSRQEILDRLSQCREKESELRLLQERSVFAATQIEVALKECGWQSDTQAKSLSVLIRIAQAFANQVEEERRMIVGLGRQKQSLALEKQSVRLQDCKDGLIEWERKWFPFVQVLLLPEGSSPSQVGEALIVLENVFGHLREAEGLQHRVKRMGDNIEDFENRASRLIAEIAPQLVTLAPQVSVAELHAQYVAAGRAETERNALETQNATDELTIAGYEGRTQAALFTMGQLKQLAQCESDQQLESIISGSEQKAEKIEEYERIAAGLIERNAVPDLQQIELEACSYELDVLISEISVKGERQKSVQDELFKTGSEFGRLLQEFERLEASEESAVQAQTAESALARIRSSTAQYLRLRVASEVLNRAIDSYRQKHQGSVLNRASELFSNLTCGDHRGVITAFGSDDKPVLAAIRKNGEQVEVEGLSDGTRDQLYLALRLAGIEHHIETVTPCPVIFDDILINCDDGRSAAVLQVISDLAKRTQVLFFTHHRHMAEIGRTTGAHIIELNAASSAVPS